MAELLDVPGHGAPARVQRLEPPRAVFRRIAAEAVILQDEAEAVIRGVRAREPFGALARRGGPLVRRFFALRDALPAPLTADDMRLRERLGAILHHHALVVSTALDLMACEWRSPRMASLLDGLDGLGPPAHELDALYAELASPSR